MGSLFDLSLFQYIGEFFQRIWFFLSNFFSSIGFFFETVFGAIGLPSMLVNQSLVPPFIASSVIFASFIGIVKLILSLGSWSE